jgi:hypothetical protein
METVFQTVCTSRPSNYVIVLWCISDGICMHTSHVTPFGFPNVRIRVASSQRLHLVTWNGSSLSFRWCHQVCSRNASEIISGIGFGSVTFQLHQSHVQHLENFGTCYCEACVDGAYTSAGEVCWSKPVDGSTSDGTIASFISVVVQDPMIAFVMPWNL